MYDVLLVEMRAKVCIQEIYLEVERDGLAAQVADPGLHWAAGVVRALRGISWSNTSLVADTSTRDRLDGHQWNIWHIARGEDWGVNTMLRGKEQLFRRDNRNARLAGISRRDFGAGMSED